MPTVLRREGMLWRNNRESSKREIHPACSLLVCFNCGFLVSSKDISFYSLGLLIPSARSTCLKIHTWTHGRATVTLEVSSGFTVTPHSQLTRLDRLSLLLWACASPRRWVLPYAEGPMINNWVTRSAGKHSLDALYYFRAVTPGGWLGWYCFEG